jgi:hypothetical protein
MRKQDAACPLPILGLVLTQPQDLWSGIACAHRVPDERDDAGRAAEMIGDLIALGARRCVVPQLGWTDNPVLLVENDKTVLLATDTDSANLVLERAKFCDDFSNGLFRGFDPILRILFHGARWQVGDKAIGFLCRSENLSALPVESDGFCALCAAVDSEKNHWRRDGLRLENYSLARGHKELLMQSQTIPSSLLVFLADPISSPGQIPNEINLARLNLPVALTLCAPATQPLKQSDIGGCSASVTPRMTKIERRAGPFPWRVRCAMTAKFFPRSSVRIAKVRRQPREDNTVRVWDAPIIRNQDAPDDVLLLADLAEAACGSVLQTSGQTEILKLLPPDQVRATRKKVAAKFGRQSSGLTPVPLVVAM